MTENTKNPDSQNRSALRILGNAFLIPVAIFVIMAIWSHDTRIYTEFPAPQSSNWIGALGDCFAHYGYLLFGLAIWVMPISLIVMSLCKMFGHKISAKRAVLWNTLLLISISSLIQVISASGGFLHERANAINISDPGGAIGYLLMTRCLAKLLSDFGASILMAIVAITSLVGVIGVENIVGGLQTILNWATGVRKHAADDQRAPKSAPAPSYAPQNEMPTDASAASQPIFSAYDPEEAARRAKEEVKRQREEAKLRAKEEKLRAKIEKQREKDEKKLAKQNADAAQKNPSAPDDKGPYLLPPLSLLNPLKRSTADHGDVAETSKKLVDTLRLFDVNATLAYTVQGPVVTKYALTPAEGTRPEKFLQLQKTLMLALKAQSLRIEAPIPGEDKIGIEIPNRAPAGISFREIIESDAWKNFKGELPLLFGKDAAGKELIADLATMPHMLVAGATGQGKSVCLNAIINGLLMSKTPEQLKLIMVDPKSVEFAAYQTLPHLIVPVITDNKQVTFSLSWAVQEMEKRLKLFSRAKVKNIYDYNHRPTFTQTDMFGQDMTIGSDMPKTVPYIIIIIDEVADLMASNGKEVTPNIARLTAKARAAGIHVILATQRPDAKIINGTIKANIPGRVAFKTSQAIDSRTILDEGGAENLIGRGDMLFRGKDGNLRRAQGAWISDDEIANITSYIEQHSSVAFDERFAQKLSTIREEEVDIFGDDSASNDKTKNEAAEAREQVKAEANASDFKKAVECIINTNRASVSHFQRRMGWGYNHSARILDMLEDAGVVGPQSGAGPRQIIMDQNQLMAIFKGTAGDEIKPVSLEDEGFGEDEGEEGESVEYLGGTGEPDEL